MTSKRYSLLCFGLVAALSTGFIGFNVAIDEFGLHRTTKAGELRIWTYNRATKYLFSLKHIPENYEAILIGSSSSATMLDTRKISKSLTYNLSMNGANICEVAPAAFNAIQKGKLRYLIICLDPYLTKDSHMKTGELSPGLVPSTYGSLFTIRLYCSKLLFTAFPQWDMYRDSWNGYRLTESSGSVSIEDIERTAAELRLETGSLIIDSIALTCLQNTLDAARAKGISIIAYHHPVPDQIFKAGSKRYLEYRKVMNALFTDEDVVLDLNVQGHIYLTGDSTNYHDSIHLTRKGGNAVLSALEAAMP